ncbi:MAG: aldo/keto reductase [Chloroflexi bacterium]|nr:aldo/keto reductase [Chloroflexota bacterium]MCY3717855.1 aldo/keto reductase [Chloroflexota bacterium]MXV92972.1 aldo/keto reductase [Chloroflexota bacterium]MXX50005.1 aldo/keto reductase [Chloroflexota bacterium]MYA94414.1 aldo/keto reductase [Chloroflexota bacterium]
MQPVPFGNTGLLAPPLIFGSTALGNLFQVFSDESKLAVMRAIFEQLPKPVVIDSAGKYGAGLALEVMGNCLRELGATDADVIISNKLAWLRAPLNTPEPTFEPGAWFGLRHDAVQDISYTGIRQCFEQGLELLGGDYSTQLISVHDPDEYLDAAQSPDDRKRRFDDILGAYAALGEIKASGAAAGIGVGAKNWRTIQEIDARVKLDWVMFANSYTLYSHPAELLSFMDSLREKGVAIINSAVFNAGFLTGGDFFNYVKLDPRNPQHVEKFAWRERFFALCAEHGQNPAEVCIQFGRSHPGIVALALSTSKPQRVKTNVAAMSVEIPGAFWAALRGAGLLAADHPYIA